MPDPAIIDKVRKLRAKADGTDNEHEADAFRKGAERLMIKHEVTEADLAVKPSFQSALPPDFWSMVNEFMREERRAAARARQEAAAEHEAHPVGRTDSERAYEAAYRRFRRGERSSRPKMRSGMVESEAQAIRNLVDEEFA